MGSKLSGIGLMVGHAFGLPSAEAYTAELIDAGGVCRALDIGCGSYSHLSAFRPRIKTVGVDAFDDAILAARRQDVHDEYVSCDLLKCDFEGLLSRLGGAKFDLVTLYGVVEHLPKREGFRLLERCEQLTEKFVLLETPNGFQEQGPEFGNEHQRHLSGWFPHDFEGLGYKVWGTTGTKYLRGYAAGPKYNFKGCLSLDIVLARLLRAHKNYRHAFNLIAVKDVRGVPARLS